MAAAEAGVALERLALVPYPGADLMAVAAALLDGLDLVAVAVPERGCAPPTGSGWPPGRGSGGRCCWRSARGRERMPS